MKEKIKMWATSFKTWLIKTMADLGFISKSKKFELGPKQKEWIASLRNNPERQLKGRLGNKYGDGTYRACCLGELGLICGVLNWNSNGRLTDSDSSEMLPSYSYELMGLHSANGTPLDSPTGPLANLNDSGKTWPEIADIVEANPENYFSKSV